MTYQELKDYHKELRKYKRLINAELDAVENLLDNNETAELDGDLGSLPTSPPPPPPPRP